MSSIIEGTWKLESFEVQNANGEIGYPFGNDAIGYVDYTPSGHFSVQYMPKDQNGNKLKGVSYFGKYEYNREKDYIVHHVEGSLFPNEEGLDKIRHSRVRGKSLTLTCPPLKWGADEEAVATIRFEKQGKLPDVTVF
jgi:hypothetical protein